MRKPKPVTVGELTARPHRPPIASNPLWSWRCRKYGRDIWSGRARRADVAAILMAIIQAPPEPEAAPAAVETVGQVMALWLESEVEGSTRAVLTVRNYRTSTSAVTRAAGALRLDRGPWAAREVWRLLSESVLAHRPTQIHTGVMLMAWRWAHGYGFVPTPCPAMPRVKPPAPKRRYTPTLDEALKVIGTLDGAARAVLTVQLATGARISEVCCIHRADVDDDGGRMVLTLGVHESARKTGRRLVPVTMPEAIAEIRAAVKTMDAMGRAGGTLWTKKPWGGRPVTDPARLRPVTATYRHAVTKELAAVDWAALGVQRFSSHALRRLAAVMLRQAGVQLEVAAHLLGHSITMMLKTYREVDADERLEAMTRARLGQGGGNVRGIR